MKGLPLRYEIVFLIFFLLFNVCLINKSNRKPEPKNQSIIILSFYLLLLVEWLEEK